MISDVALTNFGPLQNLKWGKLGRINLVIGRNSSGKTFLLKALYSAMRTIEEYQRGDVPRSSGEILFDKLYWTFQAEKLGDLVTKGADGNLQFAMKFKGRDLVYNFGKETQRQIASVTNHVLPRASNSIFLPAKEVLSLHQIILKSREDDKVFGFDDTYLDLARALRQAPKGGKNYAEFAKSRSELESLIHGRAEYDENAGRWSYRNEEGRRFPIGVTAEGIKKIAILDTLLSNRYLDPESVIFIDEPESALHPVAISKLLDIVAMLAERGIQFFMASHSYFVVKKLLLIAIQKKMSIPLIAWDREQHWRCADLADGMPDNEIINESIHLYEEEVEAALKLE